jgi:hypothetical protein
MGLIRKWEAIYGRHGHAIGKATEVGVGIMFGVAFFLLLWALYSITELVIGTVLQ